MPTTTALYLGDARIRAYLGDMLVADVEPATVPIDYLGVVGSRGNDSGFDITLGQDVPAGQSLIATIATYCSPALTATWAATDPAGNTWSCPVQINAVASNGTIAALLVCNVTSPLSAGQVISVTAPAGAKGYQYAVVVDAVQGVDVDTVLDTTTTTGSWSTTSWNAGTLTGEGLAFAGVALYGAGDFTPSAGWARAGGPISGSADPRTAGGMWRESDGEVTVQGANTTGTGTAVVAALFAPDPHPSPPLQASLPAAQPLWGAAVNGTGDPLAPLEQPAGRPLGAHRIYFNQSTTSSALSMAAADIAAGRVPWMSFKLNDSWASVAAGSADAWADQLGDDLAALGGPVMVTFHHEPEGDEPIANFAPMHERLYQFMQPHDNIRCGPIMTAWTVLNNPTYALDAVFPGDFTCGDFIGLDGYNPYGEYPSLGTYDANTGIWSPAPGESPNLKINRWAEMSDYMNPFAQFAHTKGVEWAVGEFGFTEQAAEYEMSQYGEVRWLANAWNTALNLGDCLAICYFCSAYNSKCDWRVYSDPDRLNAWIDIMQQSPTEASWG